MTVAELIKVLEGLDPDLKVIMVDEGVDFCEVDEAFEDLVCPDRRGTGCFHLCDERDAGVFKVIRLFGGSDERRPFLRPDE